MVGERGLLEAAVQYAARGYRVFPLAGKVPVIAMGENFSQASTEKALLHEWWGERYADSNIAIVTGPDNGLLALDIDARTDGFSSLQHLTAMHGELPPTVNQRTGGGGKPFLFKYPGKDIKSRTAIAPGIDVKAGGGYIVAPPSIHPETKQHYQWVEGASLFDRDLADCPSWLIDLAANPARVLADAEGFQLAEVDPQLLHYGQRALEDECRNIECASNGSQETTVNQASFAIGQLVGAQAVNFEHAYGELFAAALKMSSFKQKDPWREAQLGTKIRRGLEDGMRSPRNIPGQKIPRTGRDQEQDLITAIQEINKTHAVVQLGSRTRILKQGTCPINGWPKVDFLAQDDFKLRFSKHRYLEDGRREGLGLAPAS